MPSPRVARSAGALLVITVLAALSVSSAATANGVPPGHAKKFRNALSVSPFTTFMFDVGTSFTDGSLTATNATELQGLYKAHGATEVFARAATRNANNPNGIADHGFDAAVATGKLARDLGLEFNLELGVFRTYGDLLCQTPPDFADYPEVVAKIPAGKAWHQLTIAEMEPVLTAYGALVARRLEAEGVEVSIWDVGNEIDFGFAGVAVQPVPGSCDGDEGGPGWYRAPDGVDPAIGQQSIVNLLFDFSVTPPALRPESFRINWLRSNLWPHTGRLMAAVHRGIRSVDRDAKFSTHLSGSASEAFSVAFYETLQASGVRLTELGVSYYPTSNGASFDVFKSLVTTLKTRFGKQVFIAEFAYAAETFRPGAAGGPFGTWAQPVPGYPISNDGAAAFLRDLTAWGAVNGISGIRPWAPEFSVIFPSFLIPFDFWEPLALFDGGVVDEPGAFGGTDVARPGLDAIAEGLARS